MNINHLRYFLAVCECGSITKAAENVHMAQPSISAAIHDLENNYGFKLFNRNNKTVDLTSEGIEFLKLAKHLVAECDDFSHKAAELNQNRDIILKIGMPGVLGSFFFKKIIPNFEIQNPGIHLEIFEVPTIEGIKQIHDSKLDLLIGITDKASYSNCNCALIFATELQLAVNVNSPLSRNVAVTTEMLTDYPFVIISAGSFHYNVIKDRFQNDPIKIILHSNQVPTIRYMIENDYAVTIIYKEIFSNCPEIAMIPLDDPITANVNVFWRTGSYCNSAMKAFISYLRNIMSE